MLVLFFSCIHFIIIMSVSKKVSKKSCCYFYMNCVMCVSPFEINDISAILRFLTPKHCLVLHLCISAFSSFHHISPVHVFLGLQLSINFFKIVRLYFLIYVYQLLGRWYRVLINSLSGSQFTEEVINIFIQSCIR